MYKLGASSIEMPYKNDEELVLGGELTEVIDGISIAHQKIVEAGLLHVDEISEIGQQIQELTERRKQLLSQTKASRQSTAAEINLSEEHMRTMLNDPDSAVHPVVRAVLLAPLEANGSYYNPNTFHGVNKLADELVILSDYLEQQELSQPVSLYSRTFDHKTQKVNSQINFGYTKPEAGLTPGMGRRVELWNSAGIMQYADQPLLKLPMDRVDAVAPSSYNSHYVFADGSTRGVDHGGRSAPKENSDTDFIPFADAFELPLPAGNLDRSESAKPFVYYEHDEDIETIETPKVLGVGDNVTCAIGERAVVHLFAELSSPKHFSSKEQRRVYRNMLLTIAHQGLNLALKRKDFGRNN
jgi:hypothetical protein